MKYIEPPYVEGGTVILRGAVDAPAMVCVFVCIGGEKILSIINGDKTSPNTHESQLLIQ